MAPPEKFLDPPLCTTDSSSPLSTLNIIASYDVNASSDAGNKTIASQLNYAFIFTMYKYIDPN